MRGRKPAHDPEDRRSKILSARRAPGIALLKRDGRAAAAASLALLAVALSGAAWAEPVILPGSVDLPLAEGSTLADECPTSDFDFEWAQQTSCVRIPNNDGLDAVVAVYQRLLDERGFRFERYVSGPGVVLLSREQESGRQALIMGLDCPPGQEEAILEFLLRRMERSEGRTP